MKVTHTLAGGIGWIGAAALLTVGLLPLPSFAEPQRDLPLAGRAVTLDDADGPIASPEPDWPQWNGPRRDGIAREKNLLPQWPEAGPTLLWKIANLGRGWSSPIIVGDRLYITGDVGEDLILYAFDLEGKPVWNVKNGRSWTGSYPGARACAVYSEGKLYHMNAHGRVACFEAATGRELWAVDILERFQSKNITWAISECLVVDGPRVIVTPGGEKGLMAALDKQSGKTVWVAEPLPDDRVSHCSPLLFRHAGQRILANCTSAHGFAVAADSGKLLWTIPLRSPYGVNIATPVYGQGKIFFTTPYIFGACYDLMADDKGFRAEKAWSMTLDTCTGTTMLVGDILCGSGYKKHKSWLAIDWKSGAIRHELKELTSGAAVYADSRLYCLAEDGRVALLRPTPERLEFAGQFPLVPDKVSDAWSHPVVLHGRLYLRYHDTLWCHDVRGK